LKNSKTFKKFRKLFLVSSFATSYHNNMFGLGGIFMTSYLLYLGATAKDIGMIAAIPSLTNILQIFSVKIYEKAKSRKKVIVLLTLLQYSFFYLVMIIPKIATGSYRIDMIIGCFVFGNFFRAIRGSGILEWNNFFVPSEIRGKFFANKNLLGNLVYIIISLSVGKILDVHNSDYKTYVILLLIALVFSGIEILGYMKVEDYNVDLINKTKIKFKEMLTLPLKYKSYRYFMLFSITWNFARSLAMPYYTFYSKTVLNLDYSYIALIGSITCLIKMVVANPFGGMGDKNGWRNVLLYAGMAFAFTNIAWGFINEKTLFLYPIVLIINGIFMIGSNIAVFNLNIDLSSPKDRLLFLGFNGSVTAIFAFIGPNLASYLMDKVSVLNIHIMNMSVNGYQIVFFLSGVLQLVFIWNFAIYLKKANLGSRKKNEIQ